MALRAKSPEPVKKRLKLFMFSAAGAGKTTAATRFPRAYIIDAERGTENYDKTIREMQSVVLQTTDFHEAATEVKSLLVERHEYRTLVVDPITPLYENLLDKMEAKVGAAHGRHYGAANKEMKRLANLIMSLDMNVVITAHAKTEYGENMAKLGQTFDGWRQLDYWFDLVVELFKKGNKRMARVVKTRLEGFPDGDVFEWSYEAICRRYDPTMLERDAAPVELSTADQVKEVKALLDVIRLPDGMISRWFDAARVENWEDMSKDAIGKCIEYLRARIPSNGRSPQQQQRPPSSHAPEQSKQVAGEDLTDPLKFHTAYEKAMTDRGFSREESANILNVKITQHGGSLNDCDLVWRSNLVESVRGGLLDHLRMKRGSDLPAREQKPTSPVPMEIADQVQTWEQFHDRWNEGAQDNGWAEEQATEILAKRLDRINKRGRGQDTTITWRVGTIIALRAKQIDPATGENRVTEPAMSAA